LPQYFHDFAVGTEYRPAARTVTEADVVAFAALSGDTNPIHTDSELSARLPFGERIAHGLLGLAMSGGFLSRVDVIEGTALLLGVEWRFKAPVRFGDTIAAVIRVASTRLLSDGQRGIVEFEFAINNQRDELVQEGRHVFLVFASAEAMQPAAAAGRPLKP
jgi:acyl dehydratase